MNLVCAVAFPLHQRSIQTWAVLCLTWMPLGLWLKWLRGLIQTWWIMKWMSESGFYKRDSSSTLSCKSSLFIHQMNISSEQQLSAANVPIMYVDVAAECSELSFRKHTKSSCSTPSNRESNVESWGLHTCPGLSSLVTHGLRASMRWPRAPVRHG